jgi:hypothetical protein
MDKDYLLSMTLEPMFGAWTVKLSHEYFQWNRGRGNSTGLAAWEPILIKIKKRKFTHNFHIFTNINEDLILAINFFQGHGLGYEPSSQELTVLDRLHYTRMEHSQSTMFRKNNYQP